MHQLAFRCKTCGRLETAEHAGENDLPHACTMCGAGVTLNPRTKALAVELRDPETTPERRDAIADELVKLATTGENVKLLHPENWEVLADAPHERLAELGLEPHRVARHVGKVKVEAGAISTQHIAATAEEGVQAEDKPG